VIKSKTPKPITDFEVCNGLWYLFYNILNDGITYWLDKNNNKNKGFYIKKSGFIL